MWKLVLKNKLIVEDIWFGNFYGWLSYKINVLKPIVFDYQPCFFKFNFHIKQSTMILISILSLFPWLNLFSWSLSPLNITPRHRTFNLWGSPPLNCAWTLIHLAIVSNLHNKKLKTVNEKLIQTFHQTLGVQIIHKP